MSDSSTVVKPRIEDPSNASPSSIAASSNSDAGIVKCCSVPGKSVKRMSTNLTSSSEMKSIISDGSVNCTINLSSFAL